MKPMDGRESIASAHIADIARLMRRDFDGRARGIGITRPQWQVLTTLSQHEGVNQGGLADLMEVEPITLCRMVDRLQDADLVERRRDPADRRAWNLYVTDKARLLLKQLQPHAEDMMNAAFEGLNAADRDRLVAALERIRQNLGRSPAEAVSHG